MSALGRGYTPVFSSVFTGTLCGQYPQTAAWLYLLALADREGKVDMTPHAISALTGMPVSDLLPCLEQFCAPDPGSRSQAQEGRRLALLNPPRNWGWQIVNFDHYREKARKAMHSEADVASGKNRERMKARRDRTRPDATSETGSSDAYAYENKKEDQKAQPGLAAFPPLPNGLSQEAWGEWMHYRRENRLSLKPQALALHQKALLPHPAEVQLGMVQLSISNGWKGIFPPRLSNGRAAVQQPTFDLAAWAAKETE